MDVKDFTRKDFFTSLIMLNIAHASIYIIYYFCILHTVISALDFVLNLISLDKADNRDSLDREMTNYF